MRMLANDEAPDRGKRSEGHNVVMQYFAQDQATRLDPALTVYETLASGSPTNMVPAIRNILGGFLFSGDDVYKRVRVLSGGERTRLAVASMLLRPSNTLLLDEPTNHLDLDSKEVLLDALVDFGGTLIFVSHDRYFVERLATKIVEVGQQAAVVYPGTYTEFLWHSTHRDAEQSVDSARASRKRTRHDLDRPLRPQAVTTRPSANAAVSRAARDVQKRAEAEARRRARAEEARRVEIDNLESRIANAEQAMRELELAMAAPGFYENRATAQPIVDRHQALMWQVGDLMHKWEVLQASAGETATKADSR
jgi:ATP-binding cassette subfamily F protein 3